MALRGLALFVVEAESTGKLGRATFSRHIPWVVAQHEKR